MYDTNNIEKEANWIGHIGRGDNILKLALEGRMEGKRGRGRQRKGIVDDLKDGETYEVMKRRAGNRTAWREWMPGTCRQTEH